MLSETRLEAEIVRHGLHSLDPYEDPEFGYMDPLADGDMRANLRSFLDRVREIVKELDESDLARSATIRGLRQDVADLRTAIGEAIKHIRTVGDPDEAMAEAQAVLWAALEVSGTTT